MFALVSRLFATFYFFNGSNVLIDFYSKVCSSKIKVSSKYVLFEMNKTVDIFNLIKAQYAVSFPTTFSLVYIFLLIIY